MSKWSYRSKIYHQIYPYPLKLRFHIIWIEKIPLDFASGILFNPKTLQSQIQEGKYFVNLPEYIDVNFFYISGMILSYLGILQKK